MVAAAIALCGCQSAPDDGHQMNPFVASYLKAVASFEHIQNIEQVIWVVQVSTEYESGSGWAAEVRDERLYVSNLFVDFRTGVIRNADHKVYDGLTRNRSAALHNAFLTEALPKPLGPTDVSWSPSVTAYAGRGSRYFETVWISGSGQMYQVSQWLDDVPRESMDRSPVPIELCLPWVIAQYYRAREPEHDDDLPD